MTWRLIIHGLDMYDKSNVYMLRILLSISRSLIQGCHVYILHVMCDTYLASSILHKCITRVDQGSNYEIGLCTRMKLTSGSTNLSKNSSATCM